MGIYNEGFTYLDANRVNVFWQYFGFQYHSNLHTMQEPSQARQNCMSTNMVHNDNKLNNNSNIKIILPPPTINNWLVLMTILTRTDWFFNTIIDVDYHLIPCNHLHNSHIGANERCFWPRVLGTFKPWWQVHRRICEWYQSNI